MHKTTYIMGRDKDGNVTWVIQIGETERLQLTFSADQARKLARDLYETANDVDPKGAQS